MSTLASWCVRRRRLVLATWLLLLVALGALALGIGADYTNASNLPDSESGTAAAMLAAADADTAEASADAAVETGNIVWHSSATAVDSASIRAAMEPVLAQIAAAPGVVSVVSPYTAEGAGQLNADAATAYARVTVADDADIDPIVGTAESARAPDLQIETGGRAFTPTPSAGGLTEAIGIVAALFILLLMFRSGWAAALPIVTGVAGVVTSLFAIMLLSHVVDLAENTPTMGALIGLGVGIDYALFIVNRYRKALVAGRSVDAAVAEAVTTSGRAVVFAGGTVIAALLGVFVVDIGILTGMARGAALTVLITVVAALTLLPALLAILGTRVLSRSQRRTLAGIGADALPDTSVGVGVRWSALVDRIPTRLAVGAALIAVVLAVPALSIRLGSADASSDPSGSASHRYFATMSAGFGDGVDAPLLLVAQTPDAMTTAAFERLASRLQTVDDVRTVSLRQVDDTTSVITVVPATSAQAEQTADLVARLRHDVAAAATSGDLRVYVGGITAANIDNADATLSKLPLYLLLVAVLGFLLLAVAFRSILVPLIGAVTNLLVLAIGLSALTALFQWGWVSDLLGVGSGAPIESLVPVLLIGIVFGLSMDYQVFLVSRMHEEWTLTRDNRRAVRVGLAETSRVISAAALIMLSVFAAFGFAGQRIIAEIGVGLGLAVVADAFLVKLVLIPALMRLIGDANWWYPRWAERITPQLSVEGAPAPSPAEPGYAAPLAAPGPRASDRVEETV